MGSSLAGTSHRPPEPFGPSSKDRRYWMDAPHRNQSAAAARNTAFSLCRGHDDLHVSGPSLRAGWKRLTYWFAILQRDDFRVIES